MKRLVLPLLLVACGGPPPTMKVKTIVAEFDPSLTVPVVPAPNLLAVNPDTGLLDIDDEADANATEKAFNAWLRTLNGFPVTSVASTTFSGDLDEATISSSTVMLYDVSGSAPVPLTAKAIKYDAAARKLSVEYLWSASKRYVVVVLGGPSGVKGKGGETVVGTDAMELLRAAYPLVTCSDLKDADCRSANPGIRGKTIADERKKALKMETARLAAKPVIELLANGGTRRSDLAAVWAFRTQNETVPAAEVGFQPAVRAIPFPCDAVRGRLPEEPGDDSVVKQLKADLNQLDGFSTSASIFTEHSTNMPAVGGGLLGTSVLPSALKLLDVSATVPATLKLRTGPDQISLHPDKPLRSHHKYAVVWTKGAKTTDGHDIVPSPAWAMLTSDVQFTDAAGKSTVRTLDDANAADLEALRLAVSDGLAAAVAAGIARADVLLAWTFTTQTTAETLPVLRGKPAAWNLPTAVSGVADLTQLSQLAGVSGFFGKDFHSLLRAAKEGVFTTGNALNLNGSELDLTVPTAPVAAETEGPFTEATLMTPRQEQLKFLLVLPKTPKFSDGRIPIIIFQHGITRSRRDALFIANSIARKGYATLAIDHPMHGDRSYCVSNTDCVTGFTCEGHRCPVGAYRLAAGLDGQLGTPAVSGLKFSSTTNLAATRDQIRQLMIDTAQLVRVVKDTTAGIGSLNVDDPSTAGVTERLDVSEVGYIGMSLGSVMGSLAVAANPEITRATLNVGGASPADILTQATVTFLADKRKALDAYLKASRGLEPGTQAYDDFYDAARWMLDTADAQSFGRNYIDEPLTGYPKKKVFLSWVQDDPWVPNATTRLLINAIERTTAPANFGEHMWMDNGNHSFMMDPSSAIVLQAQDEAVGWIDAP